MYPGHQQKDSMLLSCSISCFHYCQLLLLLLQLPSSPASLEAPWHPCTVYPCEDQKPCWRSRSCLLNRRKPNGSWLRRSPFLSCPCCETILLLVREAFSVTGLSSRSVNLSLVAARHSICQSPAWVLLQGSSKEGVRALRDPSCSNHLMHPPCLLNKLASGWPSPQKRAQTQLVANKRATGK